MTVLSWFFPSNFLLCHCSSSWLVEFLDTFLLKPPSHSAVPPWPFSLPHAFLTPICQPPLVTVFKMHSHVLTFCAAAAQALVAALHSCLGPWQWSPQLVFPWCLSVHNGHSDLLKNKPGCTTCLNPQQLPVTVGPEYPGLVPGSSQILKSMAAQSLIQNNMVFAYKLRTSSGILYIISRLLIIPNTVYI